MTKKVTTSLPLKSNILLPEAIALITALNTKVYEKKNTLKVTNINVLFIITIVWIFKRLSSRHLRKLKV